MSDHPKESKRTLRRIRICDDACFDVFRLLPPKKVGLEVAAVSERFNFLVDTQFEHYRKWTLGALEIDSDEIYKWNADVTIKTLLFPQIPLPNSVVGFAYVTIKSFDPNPIAFLHSIGRLFQSNIFLDFSFFGEEKWDAFAASILPLLNSSAIIKIHFEYSTGYRHFRRVTSPSILRDCADLRSISLDQSLRFPPDDSDGSSEGQALCQWLHTPRADGRPKVLRMNCVEKIQLVKLKAHFLRATTSVNFIIVCFCHNSNVVFDRVNLRTREQMTCQQFGDRWKIMRCPIDKNEKQWAEWEEEAVKRRFGNDWKAIDIRD